MDLVATFDIPLRDRFRGVASRRGALFKGTEGWSEWSPFPDYGPQMTARWLAAAAEAADTRWPEPLRDRIPVNCTVPAVPGDRAYSLVRESGCSTAKVKVGDDKEVERVAAVRDALGPNGGLRVDANAAWDVDEAARRIQALARFDLEYVEQPVRTIEEMRTLRKRVDVPLAADEVIRLADDPTRVDLAEAADVAVLKVQPLGGVRAALRVAETLGLPIVVSSALETSIGIADGLRLAAALPELRYACGLGTIPMLRGDLVANPLVPEGGAIGVRRPEPDEDAIARHRPSPAIEASILRRLAEAREAAASAGAPLDVRT